MARQWRQWISLGSESMEWRPIGGVRVQLHVAPRRTGKAVWEDGRIKLILPAGLTGREPARMVSILLWGLLGRAKAPALAAWAQALNERYFRGTLAEARFRQQYSRWGSCSARGRISLSHRLLMAPCPLIEAVILHELAHLGRMHHGREFWAALSAADPLCERRRGELAAYGEAWSRWWDSRLGDLLRGGATVLDRP